MILIHPDPQLQGKDRRSLVRSIRSTPQLKSHPAPSDLTKVKVRDPLLHGTSPSLPLSLSLAPVPDEDHFRMGRPDSFHAV